MLLKKYKKLAKEILKSIRAEKFKKTAPKVSKDMIKKGLVELGIKKGDTIFLHSSLKRIGYVEGGAQTLIDCFFETLSPSGTLIIPTFHMKGNMYETCLDQEYIFNPATDGTQIGIIPSTFLKVPDVYRSIHPTHSVSAYGKNAEYVTKTHHLAQSTFGVGSPWDKLMKLDGKVMGLGISMGPFTFYHALEDNMAERFPIPVRINKNYPVKCKDWDGNIIEVTVTPLDPKYAKVRIDQKVRKDLRDYFYKEFTNAGILSIGNVGEARSWISKANSFYDHLKKLMDEGITIYSSSEDLKNRPLD